MLKADRFHWTIAFPGTGISLVAKFDSVSCSLHFSRQRTLLSFRARRLLAMGGGRGRTYSGHGALKGKGVGTAGRAVPKDSTLHVDLLRAFPAEDGSVLLHRNGARSDAQLLEPTFLAQLMSSENQELLNRPAKGLSMLAGSIIHGIVALQRSGQSMVRADRTALLNQLQEVADACGKLDSTRKREASVDEVKEALQEVLTFLNGASTSGLQRLAVVSAQTYICAMQVLEAGTAVGGRIMHHEHHNLNL